MTLMQQENKRNEKRRQNKKMRIKRKEEMMPIRRISMRLESKHDTKWQDLRKRKFR